MNENAGPLQHSTDVCVQHIWVDKADVCLSMGLFQQARQLLAGAHLMAEVSLKGRRR